MTTAAELYDAAPDGYGGVKLTLRRPIQTRDARATGPSLPLFGPNDSVRSATPRERGRTRDEILTPMTSGKTIARGTIWDGTGVNPKLDDALSPVLNIVRGFTAGHVVHAEDPGTLISLGRVYAPTIGDPDARDAFTQALDDAESEWQKDPRSLDNASGDLPPSSEKTKDARPPAYRNCLPGTARGISTSDYAANLKKGRATRDQAAPARVKTSADYAATLAAGRAAKRGA